MASTTRNSIISTLFASAVNLGLAAVAPTSAPNDAKQLGVPTLLPQTVGTGSLGNIGSNILPTFLPAAILVGLGIFAIPLIMLAVQFFTVNGGSAGVADSYLGGSFGRKLSKNGHALRDLTELLATVAKALEKAAKD